MSSKRLNEVTAAEWRRYGVELLLFAVLNFAFWSLAVTVADDTPQLLIGLTGTVLAGVIARLVAGRVFKTAS